MKKKDLKRHLQDYSIFSKRSSTISHAFASALSIADEYDEEKINIALLILGQDPNNDLLCAYCGDLAETWDHIKAIVNRGEFSGYGHQLNNLIPCCKTCNSAKGNKNWKDFLITKNLDTKVRIERISKYINHNCVDTAILLKTDDFKEDLIKFNETKENVLILLKEADQQAKTIRDKLRQLKG